MFSSNLDHCMTLQVVWVELFGAAHETELRLAQCYAFSEAILQFDAMLNWR